MTRYQFETDSDTFRLLDITHHFLVIYFNHSEKIAFDLINSFYKEWAEYEHWTDDSYHHEGPFRMAAIIHYCAFLKQDFDVFGKWEKENGYHQIPDEAMEYYRKNYFIND